MTYYSRLNKYTHYSTLKQRTHILFFKWTCNTVQNRSYATQKRSLHKFNKNEAMSHAMQGHARRMGHGGELWQNMVHWRRKWQTAPVFLSWEPHIEYEMAKRYNTRRWCPQVARCPICYWGREIAPEKMKRLDQSGNDAWIWKEGNN